MQSVPSHLSVAGNPSDSLSSRAGFLPILLARLPIQALEGIPVYIRTRGGEDPNLDLSVDPFTLFTAGTTCFDEDCRQRLVEHGAKFIYIPTTAHDRFRSQTESQIEGIVDDPQLAAAAKWSIIYETSNELASELLSQKNFAANLPRLQSVSRAVSSLVLSDRSAFTHVFAASHHDFYTATHMVNVGTWMVALAYAMGHTDQNLLCEICQAGVLHDVGKTLVSKETLNKLGQLTEQEWASLRAHPAMGVDYLQRAGVTDPIILAATGQHHERQDGSGYPGKLKADQIHPISKLCAVIDSFDAMTSVRPFRTRAMSVPEAIAAISRESPSSFDPEVVAAWTKLIQTVDPAVKAIQVLSAKPAERRAAARFAFECPVLVRVKPEIGRFEEAESVSASARNISARGMSLIMPFPVSPGHLMRLHLQLPRKARAAKDYTAICQHCRNYDEGWFEMGVMFCSDPSDN